MLGLGVRSRRCAIHKAAKYSNFFWLMMWFVSRLEHVNWPLFSVSSLGRPIHFRFSCQIKCGS